MRLPELLPLPELPTDVVVSVVVSAHNYGVYLPTLIASITAQTYTGWECVVVDDGSTDDTVDIVELACRTEPRVRLISKANEGALSCLRAALPQTTGQIVCLLDADDELTPDRLHAVVTEMRVHPTIGFVVHPLYVVDAQRNVLGVMPLTGRQPSGDLRTALAAAGGSLNGLGVTSGMAIRREILEWLHTRDLLHANCNNVDEFIRRCVPLLTEVAALDRPLGLRRLHGTNISAHDHQSLLQVLDNEQNNCTQLRNIQQTVLNQLGLSDLIDPSNDPDTLSMAYVRSRLEGRRHDISRHAFFTSESFAALSRYRRWYWHIAARMPDAMLTRMVDSIYSPLGLKPVLNHLRARRALRHHVPDGLRVARTRTVLGHVLRGDW